MRSGTAPHPGSDTTGARARSLVPIPLSLRPPPVWPRPVRTAAVRRPRSRAAASGAARPSLTRFAA